MFIFHLNNKYSKLLRSIILFIFIVLYIEIMIKEELTFQMALLKKNQNLDLWIL